MSDTKAFDVANLKPGDAVSIEHYCEHGWVAWDEGRVVAAHDDGVIELEDNQRFGPDGRRLFTSLRYRLRPPTGGIDVTWTPVTEALPPEVSDGESDVVLVWPRERLDAVYQRLGVYNHRKQRWDYPSSTGYALELPVTHWMPIPPGPGEDA